MIALPSVSANGKPPKNYKTINRSARVYVACTRCGTKAVIVAQSDDGKELLCIICTVAAYPDSSPEIFQGVPYGAPPHL